MNMHVLHGIGRMGNGTFSVLDSDRTVIVTVIAMRVVQVAVD